MRPLHQVIERDMQVLPEAILVISAAVFLHVSAMAAVAHAWGIAIRSIAYGLGWKVFQTGILTINALPIGGYVRLKDSREEPLAEADCHDAYDFQPRLVQALVPLSGATFLLVVALWTLGREGWDLFLSGFGQVFSGALGPYSDAQGHLRRFQDFLGSHDALQSLGLVCAKLAALNLLPLPLLNGGHAIIALAGLRPPSRLWDALHKVGLTVLLPLYGAWIVAVVAFFW